jgi:hypothetical protein
MSPEDTVHVRTGVPEDEDGILELAKIVNSENGVFKMNEDKVRALIRPSLHQDSGIVGLIGPRDKIEGLIVLRVSNYWYSDAPFLEEMVVFVHPEYRAAKGGRARKLVEFAKNASHQLGLPLMIGILNNSRTNAKIKLYERQFGAPAGAFFLYGVKTGSFLNQEIVT